VPAAIVCIALDSECAFLQHIHNVKLLTLTGSDNDTVQILFHASGAGMIKHGPCKLPIHLGDEGREHAIVPDMVIRVVLVI
jgi:hypothetical protein